MQTQKLSIEIIRILPKAALAQKYNCSVQYVRKILQGSSSCNSPRARAIRKDALDILAVLMRETVYGKASCQQWYSSRTDLHINNNGVSR